VQHAQLFVHVKETGGKMAKDIVVIVPSLAGFNPKEKIQSFGGINLIITMKYVFVLPCP